MPVPKIDRRLYKVSENDRKIDKLEDCLNKMGYDCDDPRDMLEIIEKHNLDKSQFDFPYGSYELFKSHVLKGDYDDDFTLNLASPEKLKELDDSYGMYHGCLAAR